MTMQEAAQDPSISPNKFRKLFANKKDLNYMLNWFMTQVGKFKQVKVGYIQIPYTSRTNKDIWKFNND